MVVYITNSAEETENLGKKVAKQLPGKIFALVGELGSGKTTFVKGFARGLGIRKRITSPSFVLIRRYKISKKSFALCTLRFAFLYHIDLYRLERPSEAKGLGLEEIWSNPYNIITIEWAEKIKKLLPKKGIDIKFEYTGKNKRKITIEQ